MAADRLAAAAARAEAAAARLVIACERRGDHGEKREILAQRRCRGPSDYNRNLQTPLAHPGHP